MNDQDTQPTPRTLSLMREEQQHDWLRLVRRNRQHRRAYLHGSNAELRALVHVSSDRVRRMKTTLPLERALTEEFDSPSLRRTNALARSLPKLPLPPFPITTLRTATPASPPTRGLVDHSASKTHLLKQHSVEQLMRATVIEGVNPEFVARSPIRGINVDTVRVMRKRLQALQEGRDPASVGDDGRDAADGDTSSLPHEAPIKVPYAGPRATPRQVHFGARVVLRHFVTGQYLIIQPTGGPTGSGTAELSSHPAEGCVLRVRTNVTKHQVVVSHALPSLLPFPAAPSSRSFETCATQRVASRFQWARMRGSCFRVQCCRPH